MIRNKKTVTGFMALLFCFLSFHKSEAQQAASSQIYISPRGNNSGDGTLHHPFLTLEKARDVIRNKRLSGNDNSFSIVLRGGDYYFDRTTDFNGQDRNLTIIPYKKEKVRFVGGISIDPARAIPVSGSEKEEIFPENSRSHILMVNLRELGIIDYGELKQVGFGHPLAPLWMELFVNGRPYHLSRWPNDTTVAMRNVLEPGSVLAEGEKDKRGGKFTYTGNHPSGWKASNDIWIFGYFKYGWADDAVKLTSIDTLEKTFTTVQPHRYGFSSGKPWNKWYAYNIPEEIDAPGEYYIDRAEGILYFYKPDYLESIEVSIFEKPFISLRETSNITIRGIAFESARGVAVDIQSCTRCLLDDCTFKNLGLYAVSINDAEGDSIGKENGITHCSISQTGAGGIHLFGGNRITLDSAGNYAENCCIHDFNRIVKTYCAGIQISGVANRISHCEIYNAPHTAILLSGNDHLIEYNDIHDVCQSTEDVGALYYGRNPSERGNVARFNYFHLIGSSLPHVSAVYHDDGACGLTVFGNIFYKAGTWTSLIGGGSDNSYINNIFIDCPVAIDVDKRLQGWAREWLGPGALFEQVLNKVRYNQPPYSTRYPELVRYWDEDPSFPKRNIVDKNVFVRVNKIVRGDKSWLEYSDNNFETTGNVGFINEKKQNFKLKKTSDVFKKVPGFHSIPFGKIGIVGKK
ncbi:MAG: right-handed parallel beta-helix repeat-containing protein [Bacteroidales bacterium]|jgi:hypothetical protein